MCGIAGISTNPRERGDIARLSDKLLKELESRGRDATGTAWITPEGETWFHKLPVRASVYPCPVPGEATSTLLHTRAATHGSPQDNVNNHPIVLPGIVGIHNGIVSNYAELFATAGVEPTSEVDSEGIFALLNQRGDAVHPANVLGDVVGDAAIAWIEVDQPHLLRLARLNGRPLMLATTVSGSTVFASTERALREGCNKAHVKLAKSSMWEVPEWTYLRLRNGLLVESRDIPHPERKAPIWTPADRAAFYAEQEAEFARLSGWDR